MKKLFIVLISACFWVCTGAKFNLFGDILEAEDRRRSFELAKQEAEWKNAERNRRLQIEEERWQLEKYRERGILELVYILKSQYQINFADVERHPRFWKWAKITRNKGYIAADAITFFLEKKKYKQAAAWISLVVQKMKKNNAWYR